MFDKETEIQYCLSECENSTQDIGIQLCLVWYKDTESQEFFVSYTGKYDDVLYYETLEEAYERYMTDANQIKNGEWDR